MENKIFIYLLIILVIILMFFLGKFIYWRSLRLNKIVEEYTSIGVTDIKMMKYLYGTPGVWAQYVGNKCWNVCKTNNIGDEMMRSSKYCQRGLENSLKSEKRLRDEYPYQSALAIKYKNLIKYAVKKRRKIRFVIILKDINNEDLLEFYEMKYAIENKALIWKPAPGKQTAVYSEWKRNGGKIDRYKRKMLS